MNKIFLIIQREYLTRVKKKAFFITTLLVPTLIFLMYFIIFLIAKNSDSLSQKHTIWVADNSGIFAGKFHDSKTMIFKTATKSVDQEKSDLHKHEDDFLLIINKVYAQPNGVELYSVSKTNIDLSSKIEDQLNDISKGFAMVKQGIDTAALNKISSDITMSEKQLTDKGEEDANVLATSGAGIAGAILVYLALFIYGAQVMRGVLEEKTSRIVEVVISSVKPMQLMLGKIIGVGMVGLTQFFLWIILSTGVTYAATNLFLKDKVPPSQSEMATKAQHLKNTTQVTNTTRVPQSPVIGFYNAIKTIDYVTVLGCFIFYFISGYLLYSALFAAVGSAVDSETETQQFMLPITMPLLFTYIMSFSVIVSHPDSSVSVWLSIIPFTAPVAMMVRIPFGVPGWQLALSMLMMIAGFLLTTWVASRIYRVGILMYGKKASYKELAKWFFYKE
jgi:ABC-2 type transport system permease protein